MLLLGAIVLALPAAAGLTTALGLTAGASRARTAVMSIDGERVLVVGSINIDKFQRLEGGQAVFGKTPRSMLPVKGMTLPAASFLAAAGLSCVADDAEAMVLTMGGPFVEKTGGKGANAAAAAGQTFACEFIGNMGAVSVDANAAMLADLHAFGQVDVGRCSVLPDTATGTAYIMKYEDNDNAIVLVGGANHQWPDAAALRSGAEGADLRAAIDESVCVMLQREVPDHVNVVAAEYAHSVGVPVFVDVGGTDAPLDAALVPYITVLAPNESELAFISGVECTGADGKPEMGAVRRAVAALKEQFGAVGNAGVEVIVTMGGAGSVHFGAAWSADSCMLEGCTHEVHVGCFPLSTPNAKPKDTTGAGDCFRGSYVGARYGERRSVRESMRWAAAAGSLAVETEGAMVSMPTHEAIAERLTQPICQPATASLPPLEEVEDAVRKIALQPKPAESQQQ